MVSFHSSAEEKYISVTAYATIDCGSFYKDRERYLHPTESHDFSVSFWVGGYMTAFNSLSQDKQFKVPVTIAIEYIDSYCSKKENKNKYLTEAMENLHNKLYR